MTSIKKIFLLFVVATFMLSCSNKNAKVAELLIPYITGGGGCLVKNFYKFNADRVKFVDDISAAAKGYEYMAEIQLKSGAAV